MNSIEIMLYINMQSQIKNHIMDLGTMSKEHGIDLRPVVEDIIKIVKSETGFELKIIRQGVKKNGRNNKESK